MIDAVSILLTGVFIFAVIYRGYAKNNRDKR